MGGQYGRHQAKIVLLHGIVIGLFFGAEFALIYVGLKYTLTSRVYVLLYTAPFFVALVNYRPPEEPKASADS
jgi:drug/metabolite transporter (DMT)-like permease